MPSTFISAGSISTPRGPGEDSYPHKVRKRRLEKDYPKIARRAKVEGAEIHWGDETGLRTNDVRGRSYSPKGKTPEIRVSRKQEGFSLISSVTNQGRLRWMVYEGALTAKILLRFFRRLIRTADRNLFLILDNLRVHHAKVVRAGLEKYPKRLEVFYLPSYSPELNPDERLNADLKQAVISEAPARTKSQLKQATSRHLRRIAKSPQRVRSYFQHQPVRYAA